jgi:hypothetical protein
MNENKIPRLENWAVVFRPSGDPYKAPEQLPQCLNGNVYDHQKYPDGKQITTSRIKGRRGGRVVTQTGSVYSLGKIDPNYAKAFPDAETRLMNSLPTV